MGRRAWLATVPGVAEWDMIAQLSTHTRTSHFSPPYHPCQCDPAPGEDVLNHTESWLLGLLFAN